MKAINIPKLGTVIWDKSLDYPKLLKQIVDLETKVESLNHVNKNNKLMYEREQGALLRVQQLLDTNTDLGKDLFHEKGANAQLYRDNRKLCLQLEKDKKEFFFIYLGMLGVCIVNLVINFIN